MTVSKFAVISIPSHWNQYFVNGYSLLIILDLQGPRKLLDCKASHRIHLR